MLIHQPHTWLPDYTTAAWLLWPRLRRGWLLLRRRWWRWPVLLGSRGLRLRPAMGWRSGLVLQHGGQVVEGSWPVVLLQACLYKLLGCKVPHVGAGHAWGQPLLLQHAGHMREGRLVTRERGRWPCIECWHVVHSMPSMP